jgi:Methyltransferase domain/C-methyltransferase C-terminal domain
MSLAHRVCRGIPREESQGFVTGECQACESTVIEPFFSIDQIPVSSCALPETMQAASEFGRGDLELAVCHQCGFIQNHLFDPALVDYTMPYEESQAFSPRFVAFQEELVSQLVADHELRGKTILEIGSGKGAFLEAICRAAGARGIGVDPAADSSRIESDVDITMLKEIFDGTKAQLTGDLICCRHTLEHIRPVGRFVDDVAASVRRTPGSVAFFELPDTGRILDEGAFWDVYYEHCSYFTMGSLRHLFQSSGLSITRMELGFDDQYILLRAEEGNVDSSPDSEVVASIVERCREFGDSVRRELEIWRTLIGESMGQGEVVVVWGAGSKAVGFLSALGLDQAVSAVVDVNPFKQGSFLPGSAHEVVSPGRLREIEPDLVVVMNPVYAGEISEMLTDLGLSPRLESLGAVRR